MAALCPVFFSKRITRTFGAVTIRSTVRSSDPSSTKMISRSEEHTSELQSPCNLVCGLLLEKKKFMKYSTDIIRTIRSPVYADSLGTSPLDGSIVGATGAVTGPLAYEVNLHSTGDVLPYAFA